MSLLKDFCFAVCLLNQMLYCFSHLIFQAVEFLKLVETFKEYGFKEDSIHECLQATGNDREKTLDYLMSLPSA